MKCCQKFIRPRIFFRANTTDAVGLGVLLLLVSLVLFGISYLLVGLVIEGIKDGSFFDRERYFGIRIRTGMAPILMLIGLYYVLPKFLYICSFFVNYNIKVWGTCSVCNKEHTIFVAPSPKEPF